MASCRSYAREGFIGPRCAVLRRRGLLLLGGRDLLLLPTLYAVRLDHASDRTRSAGVQNCRDRLVAAARSDDESKIAQTGSGQLSAIAIFLQFHAILTVGYSRALGFRKGKL